MQNMGVQLTSHRILASTRHNATRAIRCLEMLEDALHESMQVYACKGCAVWCMHICIIIIIVIIITTRSHPHQRQWQSSPWKIRHQNINTSGIHTQIELKPDWRCLFLSLPVASL